MTYSPLIIPRIPLEDLILPENKEILISPYLSKEVNTSKTNLVYSSFLVLNPILMKNRFVIQLILPLN